MTFQYIGKDVFPKTDAGQAQVRLRLPTGTRLERTEEATQQLLVLANKITNNNIEISSAFVGTQPSQYPVNLIDQHDDFVINYNMQIIN